MVADQGPAVRAAAPTLLALRARAEQDRPYLLAVQDVMARWADAEDHYDAITAYVQHERDQLAALQSDPNADELDLASARAAVRLALIALPETPSAAQFHTELTDALARRAQAAGGNDRIVTAEDVDAARGRAQDEDLAALNAARAGRDRLAAALERAETATAIAFAQAETRNAEHIHENMAALRTEIDMLTAAGDYKIKRGFSIPPDLAADLSYQTARGLDAMTRSGFTVTAVHAGDSEAALDALRVLREAARAGEHRILWCSTDDDRAARIAETDPAEAVHTVAELHRLIATESDQLDSQTTIVVDRASHVAPEVLADLAEHAADSGARLLLVDGDDRGWPPAPSAPLLDLLHQDLPWSITLTVNTATPARRAAQPDRDPVLEQAERCDPALLDTEVTDALHRRRQLRQQHTTGYQVHAHLWDRIHATDRDHDRASDREL